MRAAILVVAMLVSGIAHAQSLRAIRLPSGDPIAAGSARDEHALVRVGVWHAGRVARGARPALARTMDAAYDRMLARGPQPSIFVATQAGQSGGSFDALIAEPPAPRFGVVFLHGYGGNFTWPCWAIAEVVVAEGGAILCPSVGTSGRWGRGEGPAIARASIAALEARGIDRIVLAGLSNGGVGASQLLHRLEPRLDGVFLLSGVVPQRTRLPVLLVHGTGDAIARARAFRERSPNATLVELPGGHFILAERTAQVQRHLRTWLGAHVR